MIKIGKTKGNKNPCDCCKHSKDCFGCLIENNYTNGLICNNLECFVNDGCGCKLFLELVCKASTCFRVMED